MNLNKEKKPAILVMLIIDGWGVSKNTSGNIFSLIKTDKYKELVSKYPSASLLVSSKIKKTVSRSNNYFTIGTGGVLQRKTNSLVDKLENEGLKTLLVFSKERYPEMNFYFTGRKKITDNDFLLIESDKKKKESRLMTNSLLREIKNGKHDFVIASFSGLDSAAATGDIKATAEEALEIDKSMGRIVKAVLSRSGVVVITSSAGRAEAMINPQTDVVSKKNSTNPVPFIIIGKKYEGKNFDFPEASEGDLALVEPVGEISQISSTIMSMLFPDKKELKEKSLL